MGKGQKISSVHEIGSSSSRVHTSYLRLRPESCRCKPAWHIPCPSFYPSSLYRAELQISGTGHYSKYTLEVVSSLHSASSFLFLLGPGVYKPGKSFCTSGLSKSSIGSVQVNNYQYIVNKLLQKSIECLFCLGRPLHQSADFCLRGAKTVLILRYNGLALRFSRKSREYAK